MLDWFDPRATLDGMSESARSLSWNEWVGFARHDTPDAAVYTLSVPGYRRKDIAIEVSDRRIVVRGERSDGFLKPRSRSSFVQMFTLAESLDEQDVRADLHDGILSLSVAKKPAARARRIPIMVEGEAPPALPAAKEKPSGDSESWWGRLRSKLRREPAMPASS